jgi:MoaA/NifB/PqqE/SkfB family radical SAM enzyme
MNTIDRIRRHTNITYKSYQELPSPPFLVLFINSICNMKCEHCFYWRNLNRRDDLTQEELFDLSRSLGRIENLNLSGGEPFLRKDFSEICRQFIRQNGVRQIYVPSNGYYTDRMVQQISETLTAKELELFVVELSLDGMPEYHDKFRVAAGSFQRAMQTYDALANIQRRDPRLRIHSISTATSVNLGEIKRLTTYLYDRCPAMDHHNLAMIRGDRKNPALLAPNLTEYRELYEYIRRLWAPREAGRYGGIVEPMLQWAKVETVKKQTQVIPCTAGKISAVVYSNGDVSVCELHQPLGNLREKSFWDIWSSPEAQQMRASIAAKDCHCTTEVFLWPSIVYRPTRLVQALVSSKAWEKPRALQPQEKLTVAPESAPSRAVLSEQVSMIDPSIE